MADRSEGAAFSQLRRGVLEYCVMAALRDGERYGYELVTSLGEILGWVNTSWQESATGPPRRYYSLTSTGRAALELFKGEWVRFRDAVDQNLDTRGTA